MRRPGLALSTQRSGSRGGEKECAALFFYRLEPIIVMYVPDQTMTGWIDTMQ